MTTVEAPHPDRPLLARTGVDLASAGPGAKRPHATDEVYAPLGRIPEDSEAASSPGRYDAHGKWADAREARPRLAAPGRRLGFDANIAHFAGDDAPARRIEAARGEALGEGDPTTILSLRTQAPSARHSSACKSKVSAHLRLDIRPDGGVSRLRFWNRSAPVRGAPHSGERVPSGGP